MNTINDKTLQALTDLFKEGVITADQYVDIINQLMTKNNG